MTLYPDVQAKAQAEIDAYFKSTSNSRVQFLTVSDRERLPYTSGVVSEIMRWHPVINLAVHCSGEKDEFVGGYRIPGGTMVIANIW